MFRGGQNESLKTIHEGEIAPETAMGYVPEQQGIRVSNIAFRRPDSFERIIKRLPSEKAHLRKGEVSSFYNLILLDSATGRTKESAFLGATEVNEGGRKLKGKYRLSQRTLFAYSVDEAKRMQGEIVPEKLAELIKAQPEVMMDYVIALVDPQTNDVVSKHRIFSQEFKGRPDDFYVGKNGKHKEPEVTPEEAEEASQVAEQLFSESILPEIDERVRAHLKGGMGVEIIIRLARAKRNSLGKFQVPIKFIKW